jgi:hypothetical protein
MKVDFILQEIEWYGWVLVSGTFVAVLAFLAGSKLYEVCKNVFANKIY